MTGEEGPRVARPIAATVALLVVATALVVGVGVGVGGYTVHYADALAYLGDDPASCANCHVMQGHYDSWSRSGHRHVAACNDCHLPPDFVGKWVTKADNGLLHSVAFTFGGFPEPIQIKPRNARRTQQACLNCHAPMVHATTIASVEGDAPRCAGCHASAGHALR